MHENIVGGIVMILLGVPGLGAGFAALADKWRPASLAAARDPQRARIAFGVFMLLVHALLVVLGTTLLATPAERAARVAFWGSLSVVAVATVGALPLLRATRA